MSYHLYRINELYSNASGSIQFVELTVGNANGESFWSGVTLSSTRGSVTNRFSFPTHLPSTSTANTSVLIATQGFADLGIVTPDYIVPAGFLFTAGGTLDFGGADQLTHGALPADGLSSIGRSGVAAAASPRNFAGQSGSLSGTGPLPTVQGTAGNDTLSGTAASEIVDGGAGNDELRTGGGNDTVRGGSGDDALHSGPGNDTLDGGEGYDYLYFDEASAGVRIDLRSGQASGGAGNDSFSSVELIFGSRFDDTFIGNDQGVGFLGGDGNDTITGGAGRDRLEGNAGDDVIDGGDGVDGVAYYSAAFAVNVNLGAGTASGGLGNDTLRHIENAIGSVFGDTLAGSPADNHLEGGEGADTLVSSAGNDTLEGGPGIDTAVYAGLRSAYTLQRSTGGLFIVEKPDAAGSDSLPGTERLQFADMRLALDIGGAAGQTAKLLGAVFGKASLANQAYVGIGLSYLDGGMSYEALAALAMQAAGRSAPADVVALLYTNVVGVAPTAAEAAPFVALLAGGMSVGALVVLAADHALNAAQIDLVGLAQTGIAYTV